MLNIHSFIYFLKRETTIKKEKKQSVEIAFWRS